MGIIDEHWCTLCKRKLDKAKDKYLDFELIHQAAQPIMEKWRKPKGVVCMECIEKDPKLKEVMDAILSAGNPLFMPEIICGSATICSTHQPTSKNNVNCRHIAIKGDTVYCKRAHPGSVKLMVERAERARLERQAYLRFTRRVFKRLPESLRLTAEALLNDATGQFWQSPSPVITTQTNESKPNIPRVG